MNTALLNLKDLNNDDFLRYNTPGNIIEASVDLKSSI